LHTAAPPGVKCRVGGPPGPPAGAVVIRERPLLATLKPA